ncbi:MAG: VOC family protein [Chromatiales bacterium]|nr:VOC family protein [Chromatiales bacterium]
MIKGFHHAALSTPNLERCLTFYTEVVGCEIAYEFGWPKGSADADKVTGLLESEAKAAMLKLGDSFLEVFEFSSPQPKPRHGERPVCDNGITHIAVEVNDIHSEYKRMKSAGMMFHSEPMAQESGFMVYGRDPDGNVLELIEYT